jgi:phosphoglucan,water dikinase
LIERAPTELIDFHRGKPPRHDRGSEGPLPAAEKDFVNTLVAANKRCRSWREKLDFVRGLLARGTAPLTNEQLVDVAIYLRFLSTGEILCAEDGRHFRPMHHSRTALEIQERLAKLTTPENVCIVRKIYPCLPSSARTFQRAEPLTRIRDIAHRNDIPSELKREIKQSLQEQAASLCRAGGPGHLRWTPGTHHHG